MRKKTVAGLFRFVSILFLNIRKGYKETNCPRDFEIPQDAFFKYIRRVSTKKFSQVFSAL